MNGYAIGMYLAYLTGSVALTVWVARTLHRNGRVFLVDAFGGRDALADSVNHLLVVGFYLINVGFVTLALTYGDRPATMVEAVEFLSTRIGRVLVVLGVMHFFNMYVFWQARKRRWISGADGRIDHERSDVASTATAVIDQG